MRIFCPALYSLALLEVITLVVRAIASKNIKERKLIHKIGFANLHYLKITQ